MRALILAGLLALSAAPAAAQSVVDQSLAAHQTFTLGVDSAAMSEGVYFDTLTAGIAGRWTLVSPLLESPDDLRARWPATCDIAPTEITLTEPFTISLRRGKADRKQYSFSYVYAGAFQFSGAVNSAEFLDTLGLSTEERRSPALLALRSGTSDAMIFKPSPDVLVFARIGGPIDIYARCPGGTATSGTEDVGGEESRLMTALGAVFDGEYPDTEPGVRDTFVACAVAAFAPMSPKDLAIAIESEFDPPPKERERIEATYPGIERDLMACIEPVEAARQ